MEWSSKMSSFLLILLILNSTHFSLVAYGKWVNVTFQYLQTKKSSKSFNILRHFSGRPEPESVKFTERKDQKEKMMMMLRGLIGSRPPRCERVRCRSCGHCEAIQVPTNPQTKLHSPSASSSSSEIINLDYTRGDDTSNYKPMSWKCKCGNSIYNP